MPNISEKTNPLPFKELWHYSPSGTITSFCAGLLVSASMSLVAIYATERQFQGWALSLILSSVTLGGFLTQYPAGWFADRFDKRSVISALMAIGLIANSFIIVDAHMHIPLPLLTVAFIISGGSAAALFPLAVTQVFDYIDPKDAVRATSTLQITLGVGGFMAPIIAGNVMDIFGSVSLFYYIGTVHVFVMIFLLMQRLFVRQVRHEPAFPFQVATEPGMYCRTGLDPRAEYNLFDVGDPSIKLLLLALGQNPADPGILIRSALENNHLQPIDIAVHMVLALPKQSHHLIGTLVSLYPEQRLEIAQSLHDVIVLRKQRINALVTEGLCTGANEEEKEKIHHIIEDAMKSVETQDSVLPG